MLFFRVHRTFSLQISLQSLLKATGNKIIKKEGTPPPPLSLSKPMEIQGINYTKWRNMATWLLLLVRTILIDFNLALPASCLPLTRVHLYQLPDHIKAAVSEESSDQRRGPAVVPRSQIWLKPPHCYQLQSLIRTWPFGRHINGGIFMRLLSPKPRLAHFMCRWGEQHCTASFSSQMGTELKTWPRVHW